MLLMSRLILDLELYVIVVEAFYVIYIVMEELKTDLFLYFFVWDVSVETDKFLVVVSNYIKVV